MLGIGSGMMLGRFAGGISSYAVSGLEPTLVADMTRDYYRNTSRKTFDDLFTHSRLGNATMVDSDGLLKWGPHNLALNSATPATQSITVVSGADYTVECTGSGSITLSGAGTGTVTEGNPVEITASTTSLTLTVAGSVDLMWAYRSDLGGMAPVPADARVAGSTTYVPTTSTAKYLPRRHNHVYNGSAWVDAGTLIETEARTQLLHTTNTLVTQSHTVTAVPHTLHFTGTGTVTLSGASTAGPLVGTGTGEENRVSLTFTPTAGIMILIVSGTVTDAQLEVGSTPSSYTPNLAASGTVTRAADTNGLTVDSSIVPWPTPKVIGDELVTNGTFDTDVSGWSALSATHTSVSGEDEVTMTSTNGGSYQTIAVPVGSVHRITAQGRVGTATNVRLRVYDFNGIGGTSVEDTTTSGTMQDLSVLVTSTTGYLTVFLRAAGVSGQTGYFDNISVKEINPLSVCIQMEGTMTYADTTASTEVIFAQLDGGTEVIREYILAGSGNTGQFVAYQVAGGVGDVVVSSSSYYSPGVNQAFNIASRHGSTFVNGAVGGTALTANTTPVALPDLSSTELQIGYDFMGNIEQVRLWVVDIGDTGIAEASS